MLIQPERYPKARPSGERADSYLQAFAAVCFQANDVLIFLFSQRELIC